MTTQVERTAKSQILESLPSLVSRLEDEISKVVIGQKETVRHILIALACGGHCLLRGVPGLAKTLLVKTLAEALDLQFNRVQFTPDLMPSDVTGTEIIEEDRTTGHRAARFVKGPIFANIVLADEINRAPPKTQAALLEAMQELQVTVGGIRYVLSRPFFVLATENPIEQEGTYQLPEAQLDRFLFEIEIGYPSIDEERQIIARTTVNQESSISKILDGTTMLGVQELVRDIPAAPNVIDYAVRLIRSTRPDTPESNAFADQNVRWGAGPRAGQALILGAKAKALLDGRFAVSFDDVKSMAYPVLRHRILPSFRAEAEGINANRIISDILDRTPQGSTRGA